MTPEELRNYDGMSGRRAYVAFQGNVYDVTESDFWNNGEHEGRHHAGQDLTDALADAPHGVEVFERFEVVDTLEPSKESSALKAPNSAPDKAPDSGHEEEHREADQEAAPAAPQHRETLEARMRAWYRRYHPHPITVHFPIALHLFAAGVDLLFFLHPTEAYARTVYISFLTATVGGAIAMIPGTLSWWVNYRFSWARPFAVKIALSLLSLFLGIVAIFLHWRNSDIVYSSGIEGVLYHGIVLTTGVLVIIIGYYGGKLTWPSHDTAPRHSGRASASAAHAASKSRTLTAHRGTPRPRQPIPDLSILIGGAAGSGIQSLESILSDAIGRNGFHFFAAREYMSRVRGGSNTTLIRFGDRPINAPCWHVDLYIVLDAPALEHARERCGDGGVILADKGVAEGETGVIGLPMKAEAKAAGSTKLANTYAAGVVFGMLGLSEEALFEGLKLKFDGELLASNRRVAESGIAYGKTLDPELLPPLPEPDVDAVSPLQMMNGTTAVGFGALAGDCSFVASYPMSPSTGVLTFMASMSQQFDIAVEQSEDEIAALNMVLGAWYAGARAMTTTSGGGFALMCEALSLSGMTETPAVIYLAQRPGPATGLPTRTEQGDLAFAIHAGHGDFARVILAPGSLQECIDYGFLAFELADRFQVPVILMSDQHLADSIGMTPPVDFSAYVPQHHVTRSEPDYRRYADTDNGVSPRAIPGYGDGLVVASSDEHDERGQITEDYRVRNQMVAKRARKSAALLAEMPDPRVDGEGEIAVVGWGATRGAIAEAICRTGNDRLFQVHFGWVHPLDPERLEILRSSRRLIVVENNATGQFADRLEACGLTVSHRLLQADGFPLFADTLAERLKQTLKELT